MTVGRERITIGLAAGAPEHAPSPGAEGTRAQLFAEVLTAGPLSRTQLAQRTGLSQSTVTKIVNPLIDSGFVTETGAHSVGIGRPQRMLAVAAERHAVIGLKLAPGAITGVLTDLRAQILGRAEHTLADGHDPAAALAAAAAVVRDLLAADTEAAGRLIGLGVGVGGHVEPGAGRVVHSGILGWDDVSVAAPLAAATGLPTLVGNDVDALAVAERWFGHGRGVETFALVTVGPGIGCGLFLDGRLFTGSTGLAGELGHIPMRADGEPCGCGRRGCLETLASDEAILRALARADGRRPESIEDAVRLARSGHRPAQAAFATMGEELGRALATLSNLVNPARIILAGERADAYDLFGPACERAWQDHAFSTAARDCTLTVDVTDDTQWARGAACLVIREAVAGQAGRAGRQP
ncbi:ROK family transcriptional regulator [Actinospica durhamensis]|uniref:ROK family transcriptional regulator n=1 Tax=Actinospica durhamensis TaxID=1508375 RepID=A0A941EVX0_9ACTN|nr:ROK family transcriptional regulator [Actinospica durhamensis]MBR7839255.1 ROK family transcriptional regulator [Actinospica durhamensis]